MKIKIPIFVLLFCALSVIPAGSLYSSQRAKVKKLKAPPAADLKNFHEFSRNIYKGAQPTAEGFKKLKKMGIKTIIDILPNHSDEKLIEGLGFSYFQIPVKLWKLEDNGVIQYLKIVTNTKNYPVFIHCDDGDEKTGLMVAVYRMYAQNWTTYDATKEFCKTEQHKHWNEVSKCLEDIDKDKIRFAIRQ